MTTDLRNYEFRSDFARRYIAEGRQQGEANSVLAILDARGVAVPDRVHDAIAECTDHEQLSKWLRRALEVNDAEELLA